MTLVTDRPALRRAVLIVAASLMLSFGIGMLSGGLQHFDDFPARGAVLVPTGIVVSFIAYGIKDAGTPTRRIFSLLGLTVLAVATLAFFGLREVAASMETTPGGGHSHGTEELAADDHTPTTSPSAPATPAPGTSAPGTPAQPQPASTTPPHDDGHAGH